MVLQLALVEFIDLPKGNGFVAKEFTEEARPLRPVMTAKLGDLRKLQYL